VRGVPATANGTTANPSATSDTSPLVGDIAVAASTVVNSSAATAGTGYTIPASGTVSDVSSGTALAVEYQALASNGATTAGFTHAAINWTEVLVVYAAAAATSSGYPKVLGYYTA